MDVVDWLLASGALALVALGATVLRTGWLPPGMRGRVRQVRPFGWCEILWGGALLLIPLARKAESGLTRLLVLVGFAALAVVTFHLLARSREAPRAQA